MNKMKKALLLVLCAAVLVAGSVLGTLAYLTSTDSVTNTFTVGKVAITLDEAKVNADGTVIEGANRVKENKYHLLPGHTYAKDPTIHFQAESEASYLYVKVENGIASIEAATSDVDPKYTKIADQIAANGWIQLVVNDEAVENVFYKAVSKNESKTEAVDYSVFANFKIAGTVDNTTLATYEDKTIKVTAYAVQADGFTTAAAAWTAAGLN